MIDAVYRKYETFESFVKDVIFTVMDDRHAIIVCNWRDAQGLVASLNGTVLNGNSLVLDVESADNFDDDIIAAQMNDGNMLITIYDNGFFGCEPALFTDKAVSFIDSKYFIERDASSALNYAITSTIIPFQIEKKYII